MDASVERIQKIIEHPDADKLEIVKVLGYECITQKGLYSEGDIVVYIRPDAVLPEEDWTEDYRKYSPKRIKAVRLRNVWSEGVVVPLELIEHKFEFDRTITKLEGFANLIGEDVTEVLGVTHYEPPIPQDLTAKGGLPYEMPKTDEKRSEEYRELPYGDLVDISLKIDGQSSNFIYKLEDDEFTVAGRRLSFKDNTVNPYTENAKRLNLEEKLKEYCKKYKVSLALRGEQYGQGIQGNSKNPHAKRNLGFALFSVYDIDKREYCNKGSLHYFVNVAHELGLETVPIIEEDVVLTEELIQKYSKDIKTIPGDLLGKGFKQEVNFEGVVVKHPEMTFKVINKYYDSKK